MIFFAYSNRNYYFPNKTEVITFRTITQGEFMSYLEIVKLALKGRSVLAASKEWGVPQPTLRKYANGQLLPNYMTAKIIAQEAGISAAEMLETLAEEEEKRRSKIDKISASFKSLLRAANAYWIRLPVAA